MKPPKSWPWSSDNLLKRNLYHNCDWTQNYQSKIEVIFKQVDGPETLAFLDFQCEQLAPELGLRFSSVGLRCRLWSRGWKWAPLWNPTVRVRFSTGPSTYWSAAGRRSSSTLGASSRCCCNRRRLPRPERGKPSLDTHKKEKAVKTVNCAMQESRKTHQVVEDGCFKYRVLSRYLHNIAGM